jgi:hypothetical protein
MRIRVQPQPAHAMDRRVCDRFSNLLAALFLGTLLSVPVGLLGVPSASASPPPRPHLSESFYVETPSTTWAYNNGCSNGSWDLQHNYALRYDILDFGGQTSTGALNVNNQSMSASQIKASVEEYAHGYYNCSGSTTLYLGVGTNNSVSQISTTGGAAWANMIDSIGASSMGQVVASQITFRGADDIEDWYSTTSAGAAEQWAQGFDGATTRLYNDFGDASGCSQTSYAYNNGHGLTCSSTNSSFTQHAYWYLSWGEPAALATPEIYNSGMPQQWREICLFGYYEENQAMIWFTGPLTQNHTYTAVDSWNDFWNDLNPTACAQTPAFEIQQDDA